MSPQHYLHLTIRFLDSVHCFHGKGNASEPEWPPSPLRVFQALVDAAANGTGSGMSSEVVRLLEVIQGVIPELICPEMSSCNSFRIAVPNNDLDVWAAPVSKFNSPKKQPSELKAMKTVQPVRVVTNEVDDPIAVSYLYQLPAALSRDTSQISSAFRSIARSITHVGWGIDMVAADADVISETEAHMLEGVRWQVAPSGGIALRVPKSGTLDDLMRKHQHFLNRLTDEGFKPVPPLREFDVRYYRRSTDPESRPYCVFSILKPDASGNRAFNTARRTRDVAAWIRHAAADVCESAGWPDFLPFVHGHRPDGGGPNNSDTSSHRFQYLPLPTINAEMNRVESIRRVMIAAPVGFEDRINFIRRRLLGHALKWEGNEIGILNIQTGKDWVRDQYTGNSSTWTSVTPVILDGFDDHNAAKTQKLIRKAMANARIAAECDFEWQPFGFRQGVEPVREFNRPEKLNGTMVHVRLRFKQEMRGPIAIGAGRYRGFGLLVADD